MKHFGHFQIYLCAHKCLLMGSRLTTGSLGTLSRCEARTDCITYMTYLKVSFEELIKKKYKIIHVHNCECSTWITKFIYYRMNYKMRCSGHLLEMLASTEYMAFKRTTSITLG